jgi:DNA-binding XRE family transcriptional regulator
MPINAATIGSDHQISKSTFSDRVELLLNARGCSKAWLANELGVSKQALNHILRHAKKPKFVCEIAILFDINPLWLQTGEQSNQQKLNMPLRTISLYAFDDILREKQIQNITQLEKIFLKPENEHKHFALLLHDYPAMKPKFENNSILLFDEDVTPKNGA